MYAIVEDSGSQYKVGKGDIIRVDLRDLAEDQTSIEFDRVLLVGGEDGPMIGTPHVANAKVTADVLTEIRGEKVTIIKFRRRKTYRRKKGHRQRFLRVRVTDITS